MAGSPAMQDDAGVRLSAALATFAVNEAEKIDPMRIRDHACAALAQAIGRVFAGSVLPENEDEALKVLNGMVKETARLIRGMA